jgi:hypothetical protein
MQGTLNYPSLFSLLTLLAFHDVSNVHFDIERYNFEFILQMFACPILGIDLEFFIFCSLSDRPVSIRLRNWHCWKKGW